MRRGLSLSSTIVEEVLDIVSAPLLREFTADRPGILGSLVIDGSVTDVIDIAHYWRIAAQDVSPLQTRASVQTPKQALIVDSSPFHRNLVAPLLSMAGYRVTLASNIESASALAANGEAFEVVLMDANLRDGDMLSAISAPVIGLYNDPQALQQNQVEGFDRLACRFDRDEVLNAIESVKQDRDAA
jgi:two-component system, chemotaxis family, sensor kinase CheA